MRLKMQPYATAGILASSIEGQKAFVDLVQRTPAVLTPEVCFLDFESISVATASFLRDSVVAYRNHARSHWTHLYPVLANMNATVKEEFADFLRARGDAFVMCALDSDDHPTNVQVIGQLDGKQLTALKAVLAVGEADAPTLAAQANERVGPTAWNNRLTALVAKGLLVEVTTGRNKRYRPVLEALTYGT